MKASSAVYEVLHLRIVSGKLKPGSRLSVPAIARELDVSRSPVREAVMGLVGEGLAQETHNRGAVVTRFTPAALVSLYEAREALEGMAARLAAPRFGTDERQRMLGILREHDEVARRGDFLRHIEVDAAFHLEIRRTAGSPTILRMLDEIQAQVAVAMRSTSVSGGMKQAVEEHRAIFDVLVTGEPEGSEQAARRHIHRLTGLLKEGAE
ncbi:GntR family transcriptional regulator [Glaciibacter superstes]|uniref:GntR family transcriptional regulator n=1 Tax=Glaciibacter superstes TaxID=501023 RepID=UPI0003B629A4|nr:GntR family transcriptional regulator [Glaciibacter superstes]